MPTFDDHLREELSVLAQEAKTSGTTTASQQIARRARRRRLSAFAVGLVVAVATAAGLSAVRSLTASTPAPANRAVDLNHGRGDVFANQRREKDRPCANAASVTLAQLVSTSDTPVWLPPPTAKYTLTGSWTCGGAGTFNSFGNLHISYELASQRPVEDVWKALIAQDGGRMEDVNGRSVLVQPALNDSAVGHVLMVVNKTLVRIYADSTVPVTQLVELASAIETKDPISNTADVDAYLAEAR